ncbi:MAG: heavy metal-responsive transcriptional regulator, partial [Cyanobacteria bacterium]|nr:heavy metal-responsive transcriptional regulator [Cyanobacteriota bacterium]
MDDLHHLQRGEVAQRAGVPVETLRYYEKEGLLKQPLRGESRYRQYKDADVQQVLFIKRAQALGFTLKEIKELLVLKEHPEDSAAEMKSLALEKIQMMEAKIQILMEMKTSLM